MNPTLVLPAALLTILCLAAPGISRGPQETPLPATAASVPDSTAKSETLPGVAVVELFTSQGCSSCPPADRTLAALAKEQAAATPVDLAAPRPILLAFHVDYWDNLGWKDPFGSAAFSQRQRAYSAAWKSRNVYTPQMVVNGSAEFVGSDATRARAEIASAMAKPADRRVIATGTAAADGTMSLTIEIGTNAKGIVVSAAATQDGLTTAVQRGENAGRDLSHARVVRAFGSAEPTAEGHAEIVLTLPAGVTRDQVRIAVWAQDSASMRVLGATDDVTVATADDKPKTQAAPAKPDAGSSPTKPRR